MTSPTASSSGRTPHETPEKASRRQPSFMPSSTESLSSEPEGPKPPGAANISVRGYIYYMPFPLPDGTPVPYSIGLPDNNPLYLAYPPSEPTNTLVLTSPASVFVDLRPLKGLQIGDADSPNQGEEEKIPGAKHGENRDANRARLEWGFAGQSTSTALPDDGEADEDESSKNENDELEDEGIEADIQEDEEGQVKLDKPRKCVWYHWVDNRYPVGFKDIPIDKGDMYTIPDSDFSLEHGHAEDPKVPGRWRTHEEMWRDIPILACAPSSKRVCVVLRTEGEMAGARWRGVIIRLGQFIQGIIKRGDLTSVERWEFIETEETGSDVDQEEYRNEGLGEEQGLNGKVGGWTRTVRIGADFLPCLATAREEELEVGMEVNVQLGPNHCRWIVEEWEEW